MAINFSGIILEHSIVLRFALLLPLFFTCSNELNAADRTASVQSYAERSRWERVRYLRNTPDRMSVEKDALRKAKKGLISTSPSIAKRNRLQFVDADAKQTAIRECSDELNRRKSWLTDHSPMNSHYFATKPFDAPRMGQIMYLDSEAARIIESLGEEKVLMEYTYKRWRLQNICPARTRDPLVTKEWVIYSDSELIFFKSPAFKASLDEGFVELNGLFWISGLERYAPEPRRFDTLGAGNKLFLVMEPISLSSDEMELFTRDGELRRWISQDGEFLGEALLDYRNDKVVSLRYRDNTLKRVRRNDLSSDCKVYLQDWLMNIEDPAGQPPSQK